MSDAQDLYEALYLGVQRDYDLAFNAHARAMNDLRAAERDLDAALTLPHQDPVRQTFMLRWYQARAAERVAGDTLERSGQTLEALPYSVQGQR